MLHAIKMMISMKKGRLRSLLILLIIEVTGLVVGILIPIEAQHAFAKLHLKIRCAEVSNL
jgi:hypothetical protein